MSTNDFASAAFERTLERIKLALSTIHDAEASGNSSVVAYSSNLFEVAEILQDAYFMRDTMVEAYYDDLRERDLPMFQELLKNSTNLMRSLVNYVILSDMFFTRRIFCTYCSALCVVLHHPDVEGLADLVPEEYTFQSFRGQKQYEQDHLLVYFVMLRDIVEESFKALEFLRIPPAARPAPPPAASNPAVTGPALPPKFNDGATSDNHAGSDAGDQETDTYLDLNLHPPGYEFDCERGRNGASTSTDPASNGTDHDVEVADPGNIHIRSMISVAGYCPVCGCSGVGYQRTCATDAANAEGSDEADVAGSGLQTMDFI